MKSLLAAHGDAVGSLEEFGNIWTKKADIEALLTYEVEEEFLRKRIAVVPAADRVDADSLWQIADYAGLKEYVKKDRKKIAATKAYIGRMEVEGADVPGMPGHKRILIQYYTKYGLPGRRYARGAAGQWLTKEARAVAFGAFTVDADIEDCNFALCDKEIDQLPNPDK